MRELDKHMRALQRIGLVLESKELGEKLSVHKIAKEARLHYKTTKKALERLYYSQNFIPRIDLEYEKRQHRVKVVVSDFPSFFSECTEIELLVLLKLFNLGGYLDKEVEWQAASEKELRAVLDQRHLIRIDEDSHRASLTMEGVERALDTIRFLAWIRDSAIRNLEETSKMLRDIKLPVYPAPHILGV